MASLYAASALAVSLAWRNRLASSTRGSTWSGNLSIMVRAMDSASARLPLDW